MDRYRICAGDGKWEGSAIYKQLLLNLLAVIHRDGGHYTDDHGPEKSTKDAIKIVVKLIHKETDNDRT